MDSSSVLNREAAVIERAAALQMEVSNWGKVTAGSEQTFLNRWLQTPLERRPTAIVAWDRSAAIRSAEKRE